MKIRLGFVSNSSSSSFIVTLPHKPEDWEELMGMMFPGRVKTDIIAHFHHGMTVGSIAGRVFQDMETRAGAPVTFDSAVVDSLVNSYELETLLEEAFILAFNKDVQSKEEFIDETLRGLKVKLMVSTLLDKVVSAKVKKDGFVFYVSYSDNEGDDDTLLEHGDIFENLPHERTSHH